MRLALLAAALFFIGACATQPAGHQTHAGHDHTHSKTCGHKAVAHGTHSDYEHDGHTHCAHEGHYDERT